MPSEAPLSVDHGADKGLPPVLPPSGKFIAQLFLVPMLIVALGVGVWVLFIWLTSGSYAADKFLEKLDSPNADVRWRAASDLAQVLPRDEKLASHVKFALDVAERLRRARDANATAEKEVMDSLAKLSKEDREKKEEGERKKLQAEQKYVLYLIGCMGNFLTPVGVDLLKQIAVDEAYDDPQIVAPRRWQAIWALAKLGDGFARFDKLSQEKRQAMIAELDAEAKDAVDSDRGKWAAQARACLKKRQDGEFQTMGVEKALERCLDSKKDALLREVTAFALNFWQGTAEENKSIEKILVDLAADLGAGEDDSVHPFLPRDHYPRAITRKAGSRIRYNATVALARRGSDKVDISLLKEMLDEQQQKEIQRVRFKDGKESPDLGTIQTTLITTLQAVTELHRKNAKVKLEKLQPLVEQLKQNSNSVVRSEADKALAELARNN